MYMKNQHFHGLLQRVFYATLLIFTVLFLMAEKMSSLRDVQVRDDGGRVGG